MKTFPLPKEIYLQVIIPEELPPVFSTIPRTGYVTLQQSVPVEEQNFALVPYNGIKKYARQQICFSC